MAEELISRQAALDIFDDIPLFGSAAQMLIDAIPAVDAVEVVRCKDCKYLYCCSAVDRRFYCRHWPKGLEGINVIEDNPFCSYGERKDGEANE